MDMPQLALTTPPEVYLATTEALAPPTCVSALDETPPVQEPVDTEVLMAMPLTAAKRCAAATFERSYLIRVMERAGGSVSEGARLAGLDRTNFRRLLQRHGLR